MTIPNQAPLGVWGSKRRSEATRGHRPGAHRRPAGADSKGILRSSITPNFNLLAFGLLKKTNLKKLGC